MRVTNGNSRLITTHEKLAPLPGIRPFRRLFEPPRVKLEWKTLRRFATWGVPASPVVAYGREFSHGILGKFTRGALVTLGIPDVKDLRQIIIHEGARAKVGAGGTAYRASWLTSRGRCMCVSSCITT